MSIHNIHHHNHHRNHQKNHIQQTQHKRQRNKQKNNYGPLYKEGAVADPEATWEKAEKQNLGFEMSLFDKLSVTLDLFKEKRKDILMQRNTVPIWFEVVLPIQKFGKNKKRGWEMKLY